MCCFSRPVDSVSSTKIFARMGEGGRQFLVYTMSLNASEDLAMVLPIPVVPRLQENAVRFINLSGYPRFFAEADSGFPAEVFKGSALAGGRHSRSIRPLPVFHVGNFEASFVPSVNDFLRLDERFRMPPGSLDKLKSCSQFGFAVFKLKPGMQTLHPMVFEFPTAQPARLYFPTVHIHDGKVHGTALFDHLLYCQTTDGLLLNLKGWQRSSTAAGGFVDVEKSEGIVLAGDFCYKLELSGFLENKDTFVNVMS
jgi:hypothetical protein